MVSIEIRCSRDRSLRISGAIISGNVSADASPPPPSPLLFDYRAFFVGTGERESLRAAAPRTCSFRARAGDFGGL